MIRYTILRCLLSVENRVICLDILAFPVQVNRRNVARCFIQHMILAVLHRSQSSHQLINPRLITDKMQVVRQQFAIVSLSKKGLGCNIFYLRTDKRASIVSFCSEFSTGLETILLHMISVFVCKLEIHSVERGICPIAEYIMNDSVIFQCACVKLPYLYFRSEI